jgi:ribonuclease III
VTALPKSDSTLVWVQAAIGYRFHRSDLVHAALTHRSAAAGHNERLEFLGDSVLNCVVARLLYEAHPEADEGALSRLRACLVSGEALAQVAAQMGLGEYLRLGPGEMKSGGFRRASILADALEALFGAVFLDGGFDATASAITRMLEPLLSDLPAAKDLKDPKTRLQEALQAQGMGLPTYTLTGVSGEAHAQSFEVKCEVAALSLSSTGAGAGRRRAEQLAAERMLRLLP